MLKHWLYQQACTDFKSLKYIRSPISWSCESQDWNKTKDMMEDLRTVSYEKESVDMNVYTE